MDLETCDIAQKVLVASISTLTETKDENGLKALASAIGVDLKKMVHENGHFAVAKFMFNGEFSILNHLLNQNFGNANLTSMYLAQQNPNILTCQGSGKGFILPEDLS